MDELQAEDAPHIARREVLLRGAALGAALAVASPVVQGLGRVSAFAQGSPPPPPPPPATGFTALSYVGLVFTCDGIDYRAKWEEGEGSDGWGDIGGENLPQCPTPVGWSEATVYPDAGEIGVSTTYVGGELYQVTYTLPQGCTASNGSGAAKGGNPDNLRSSGFCVPGVVGDNPRVITFTAPTS